MLNTITIMGRLVRDPELRMTQTGKPVASFTLAVERDYADSNGKREVDFIDCVSWGGAEFVNKYFSKGRMACVTGRLQLRKWTDQNGNNRYATEVIADSVYFADSNKAEQQQAAPQQSPAFYPVDVDDDMPF